MFLMQIYAFHTATIHQSHVLKKKGNVWNRIVQQEQLKAVIRKIYTSPIEPNDDICGGFDWVVDQYHWFNH